MDSYIHLPSKDVFLKPVAIGSTAPPVQSYTIYNDTETEMNYELDLTGVKKLAQENYSFPVFECLNPRGKIPPNGESVNIDWIFLPIEVKEYNVKVPIKINGVEGSAVTFHAKGYHPEDEVREP
jgi:hypothetical protein